jgi:hypothetical protein
MGIFKQDTVKVCSNVPASEIWVSRTSACTILEHFVSLCNGGYILIIRQVYIYYIISYKIVLNQSRAAEKLFLPNFLFLFFHQPQAERRFFLDQPPATGRLLSSAGSIFSLHQSNVKRIFPFHQPYVERIFPLH